MRGAAIFMFLNFPETFLKIPEIPENSGKSRLWGLKNDSLEAFAGDHTSIFYYESI